MRIEDHYLLQRTATTFEFGNPKTVPELISELEQIANALPDDITEIEDFYVTFNHGKSYLDVIYKDGDIIDSLDLYRDNATRQDNK